MPVGRPSVVPVWCPAVSGHKSQSHAFHTALLDSERLRIVCVLAFIGVLIFVYSIRTMLFGFRGRWTGVIAALLALAAIDIAIYWMVRHALKAKTEVSAGMWFIGISAELCVPTLCILFLVNPNVPVGYQVLANPWVLIFFPVITLSMLHLNPSLSRFSGVVAGCLYLAAAYYHGWRPALVAASYYEVKTAVVFCTFILAATGFVAGAVAGQIRKHVEAALLEAELRQQVQHELDIARSIQQSLLPEDKPGLAGFEVAGWNRSADATGGDFFDWKYLADGRLVVTLADVTGHGLGPALIAAVCRAYSRACFDDRDTLVPTMQAINRLLSADLTPPHFATFVAAVCDERNSAVQLFSAGQGPLLAYSSSKNAFTEVQTHSIPLGLMPEFEAAEPAVLHMDAGDLIVLLTDGFIEWRNNTGHEFGIERVKEAVRRATDLKPDDIIRELYASVRAFASGTPQQDDLTAVVIKRVPVTAGRTSSPESSAAEVLVTSRY